METKYNYNYNKWQHGTQVYINCWQPSIQPKKAKPIYANPKEKIVGNKFLTKTKSG